MKWLLFLLLSQLYSIFGTGNVFFKTKWPIYKPSKYYHMPRKPEDYCNPRLCPPGEPHVGCSKKFWGPACPKTREGVNMKQNQKYILALHNNYRRVMVRQGLIYLPRAKHLPNLVWNEDFAVLAMRVTNYCDFNAAPNCTNSRIFPNVGQTRVYFQSKDANMEKILRMEMLKWWTAAFRLTAAQVKSFPQDAKPDQYNFARMISERSTQVGCGITFYKVKSQTHYFLTCNYNKDIKPGDTVYNAVREGRDSVELVKTKPIK